MSTVEDRLNGRLQALASALAGHAASALNYIEHSAANRGKAASGAEWDANVRAFRETGPSALGIMSIGLGFREKASVDLAGMRDTLAQFEELSRSLLASDLADLEELRTLCKRSGIRLVEAQEEEIRGRWDWLDEHGNASDTSLDSERDAAVAALEAKFGEVWRHEVTHGDTRRGLIEFAEASLDAADCENDVAGLRP